MYSLSFKVCPTSTARFEGEIIFIFVTLRSMISSGKSNSPTMHRGIAPPHGLQLSIFLSTRKVSQPPLAKVSAAHAPAGPPPMTATRSLRPSRAFPEARTMVEILDPECCGTVVFLEGTFVPDRSLELQHKETNHGERLFNKNSKIGVNR